MQSTALKFPENAKRALADPDLQASLRRFQGGFPLKRKLAIERLPEFDALRDAAVRIKEHTLAHLDLYLERFEQKVIETGGRVHWCADAEAARRTIVQICRDAQAKTIAKGKSMIGEELGLNERLEAEGFKPVETDLGEYIIQLRQEPPSHIIAPAIHLSKRQVADAFRKHHVDLPADRDLEEPAVMLSEARAVLRRAFLSAEVGITGANLLIAETGSIAIVTNEGNGDLSLQAPRVHIAIASIEKVTPTLDDAAVILRLLARSATGQDMSVYTTFVTGPKRADEHDGPAEFHVVLLDNGRSRMLGDEFHDMLRCIRCGACINHCPIYSAIGGHAYGWVYSGPMGAVLIPNLIGIDQAGHLPNASTLCGRCEEVCPMRIPLPRMLRSLRERQYEAGLSPKPIRYGLRAWGFVAQRPALYRLAARVGVRAMALLSRGTGRIAKLPGAGGWTKARDLPAPAGKTFQELWSARGGRRA